MEKIRLDAESLVVTSFSIGATASDPNAQGSASEYTYRCSDEVPAPSFAEYESGCVCPAWLTPSLPDTCAGQLTC